VKVFDGACAVPKAVLLVNHLEVVPRNPPRDAVGFRGIFRIYQVLECREDVPPYEAVAVALYPPVPPVRPLDLSQLPPEDLQCI
jgi:hypothetical protein